MTKEHMKAETRYDDLSGIVSLNFQEKEDFRSFASSVAHVDLEKYEPIALRAYLHHENIITIYALDKEKYQDHQKQYGKLLVKKFKVEVTLNELFSRIKQIDFTLIKDDYNVEDFEVTN